MEWWNEFVNIMTGEAFKIGSFVVPWWYIVVAAVAVVAILLIVVISVAVSKKKKKKKALAEKVNATNSTNELPQEKTNKDNPHPFNEISPDWQPVVKAEDKPMESSVDSTAVEESTQTEQEEAVIEEVAENIPEEITSVEETPATQETLAEEPVEQEANEEPAVSPMTEQPVVQEVKEEPAVIQEVVQQESAPTAEQEAVATTAPRALPKKKTKTTKKTAKEIADEIEEKTGSNPRIKKNPSDKPAVVGKDKLPKKSAKAKKEEVITENNAPVKNTSDELPLITTDPNVESFGKFVIIKNDENSTRPYHFRLLANNGQILFESESYKTKPRSNSIIAFKKIAVVEENFEIDVDKANNWRYKLYNNAHTVIGVGESYSTKQGCENSVQSVIKFAESARYLEDQSEN